MSNIFLPDRLQPGLHDLGQQVKFEWLAEGKIAVFTVPDATRAVVDIYMDATTALVHEWSLEQPFLMLCDASNGTAPFSMAMRERVERLVRSDEFQALEGRFALVMQRNFLLQIIRMFMITLRPKVKGPEPRIFFTYADALHWLEEAL